MNAHTLQEIVEANLPGLWPMVKAGLSVAATLLLEDNDNPMALVFVGGSGTSKTTVLRMFEGHSWTYLVDNFSPAAFVSQAANVASERLADVDLLPWIKDKLFLTPELAPTFRGRENELTDKFSILTRILDGQGLTTHKAVHGRRGYSGDYLFSWLGATTPIDERTFRIMAQMGTRLFFFAVPTEKVSADALVSSVKGETYRVRLGRCRKAVHAFLSDLQAIGVRKVKWQPADGDGEALVRCVAEWSRALAAMRGEPTREPDPKWGGDYTPAAAEEAAWRAWAALYNLARASALVEGRLELTAEDLPLVAHVAVSSMPPMGGKVFRALVEQGGASLTARAVGHVLGAQHPDTARRAMADVARRGVTVYLKGDPGQTSLLSFAATWAWFASDEARTMLAQALVTPEGVCAVSGEAASPTDACGAAEAGPVTAGGVCEPNILDPMEPVISGGVCVVSGSEGEEEGGAHGSAAVTGGDLGQSPTAQALKDWPPCSLCGEWIPKAQFAAHMRAHEEKGL